MTDRDAKLCDIAVQVKHETDKAFLVTDGAKDVWLPKSQVELDDSAGDEAAIVTMPEWLAKDKGLMILAAYIWFVRNIWRSGRTVATNNLAFLAFALDVRLAAFLLYGD